MSKQAVHLIASGRVQGVGFRFFVRTQASAHGINGWVKNLPNGNVEILAEGERSILDIFIDLIKDGPTFGRVDDLLVEWQEAVNHFRAFDIDF